MWIKHDGKSQPVDDHTFVLCATNGYDCLMPGKAYEFDWEMPKCEIGAITEYRVMDISEDNAFYIPVHTSPQDSRECNRELCMHYTDKKCKLFNQLLYQGLRCVSCLIQEDQIGATKCQKQA